MATVNAPAAAVKHDTGKARFDLIPPEALEGLARLYAMGAEKYAARNWEKGMDYSRLFAAMQRHAWTWFGGENHDAEDGQHHLLSVMWCAAALYTYQARSAGTDDRPEGVKRGSGKILWNAALRTVPGHSEIPLPL